MDFPTEFIDGFSNGLTRVQGQKLPFGRGILFWVDYFRSNDLEFVKILFNQQLLFNFILFADLHIQIFREHNCGSID